MAKANSISWEAAYPYFLSFGFTGALCLLDEQTPKKISDVGFNLPAFFGSIQNIELFASGIMFSIFVFAMAPAAGFIGRIQSTKTFGLFRRYVVEAIVVGIGAAIVTVPLANASDIKTIELPWMHKLLIGSLFLLLTFALLTFRVVRILLFWSKQQG